MRPRSGSDTVSLMKSIWAFAVLAFAFGGVFAAERAEIEVKFKD